MKSSWEVNQEALVSVWEDFRVTEVLTTQIQGCEMCRGGEKIMNLDADTLALRCL